jgi:hypothetical protein
VSVEAAPSADAPGHLESRVRDTGAGIPPEKLESIFQPFVQVDRRSVEAAQGSGLGLANSREMARGMGGELTAESAPGAGSTFTLRLPRAAGGRARGRMCTNLAGRRGCPSHERQRNGGGSECHSRNARGEEPRQATI